VQAARGRTFFQLDAPAKLGCRVSENGYEFSN
jgi:hypothetical protein